MFTPPSPVVVVILVVANMEHFKQKIIDIYYRLMMTILERRQQYVQNNAFWHFLY